MRGLVQGVGFRPTVWRVARALGLAGDVRNDGSGVLIRLWGERALRDAFCERLLAECPPLARIRSLCSRPAAPAAPVAEPELILQTGGLEGRGRPCR